MRFSPWPERCAGEIDSFIAARGIGLANFILNDPNPAWKNQAAEFIERVEKRLRRLLDGRSKHYDHQLSQLQRTRRLQPHR
jgi:hypothetical protein